MDIDPYQAMGVNKQATADEIKNTYRKLAKKFHPDLNPGNKLAEKKFREVAAAYEIIGTPENRAKFDRGEWPSEGAAPNPGASYRRPAQPGGGRYDFNFDDFDPSMFGRAFRGARAPAQDELYQMQVSPRDSIVGAEREISLPSGKRLKVKIPAGIAEGSRLRFAGQGSPGFSGASDVYVEIQIAEDSRFQRVGKNLQYELEADLVTGVLGGEAKVPTPEGEVMLKIPKHSSSGKKIRIPGKGLFEKGDKSRGDLIVAIKLVMPKNLDEGLESALRDWQSKSAQSGEGEKL